MRERARVSSLLEITPRSPFVQLSSRGPRDKVVFSCFNAFQLLQRKDRCKHGYCVNALKAIRDGPSPELLPWPEEPALSCQAGLRPGVHGAHVSLASQERLCPAGRVMLLQPEVLESTNVVELV